MTCKKQERRAERVPCIQLRGGHQDPRKRRESHFRTVPLATARLCGSPSLNKENNWMHINDTARSPVPTLAVSASYQTISFPGTLGGRKRVLNAKISFHRTECSRIPEIAEYGLP